MNDSNHPGWMVVRVVVVGALYLVADYLGSGGMELAMIMAGMLGYEGVQKGMVRRAQAKK